MKSFLQRFAPLVLGVLVGFDRWRFRGSKRMLCYPSLAVRAITARRGLAPPQTQHTLRWTPFFGQKKAIP